MNRIGLLRALAGCGARLSIGQQLQRNPTIGRRSRMRRLSVASSRFGASADQRTSGRRSCSPTVPTSISAPRSRRRAPPGSTIVWSSANRCRSPWAGSDLGLVRPVRRRLVVEGRPAILAILLTAGHWVDRLVGRHHRLDAWGLLVAYTGRDHSATAADRFGINVSMLAIDTGIDQGTDDTTGRCSSRGAGSGGGQPACCQHWSRPSWARRRPSRPAPLRRQSFSSKPPIFVNGTPVPKA